MGLALFEYTYDVMGVDLSLQGVSQTNLYHFFTNDHKMTKYSS